MALFSAPVQVETFQFSPPRSLGVTPVQQRQRRGRGFQSKQQQSHHQFELSMALSDNDIGDELTKQDLTLRVYEVRDYYRQRPDDKVTEADVCMSLLRTRLSKLRLNRCFVGQSTIAGAGNGLFASRDIAEGELITLYPGDAVLIQDSTATVAGDITAAPVGVMFGSHVKAVDRSTSRFTSQEARSYETEINKYTSIVADPLIGVEDAAYLSHFINDGAFLQEFDDASRKVYAKETAAKCNAANLVVEGAHMATVATAAIDKGAEVFISYGAGYWLCRSFSESETTEKAGVVVEIDAPAMPGRHVAPGETSSGAGASNTESRNDRRKKNKKKKAPKVNDKKKGFGM